MATHSPADGELTIAIRGLSKRFGAVQALRGVDLDMPPGLYGLLGPNGAGKTTLMRILAGILRPGGGQIRVGPHDMTSEAGRLGVKRILGYLPQDLGVYPDLSAAEFLDYIALLKGLADRRRRRARVDELLATVGLAEVAGRKLRGFSGGMRRRVGIAQALLNDPRLLIVDEPTVGLDPEERIRFRTLLDDLAGARTVLLSTHIVEDVAQTAAKLAVLADGAVIFQGATNALREGARGRVWTLDTVGPAPVGGTVVAALTIDSGVRYRIVADKSPHAAATPTEPTLEEEYVALMRECAPAGADPNP